jgi:hypothetical protein
VKGADFIGDQPVFPRGRRHHFAARVRRPELPPHRLRRRPHRPRHAAHAVGAGHQAGHQGV